MKTLICIALQSELPRHKLNDLRADVLYTGVGKVNATLSLALYLNNYPDITRVVNVGSAGGNPSFVSRGEVYQFSKFIEDLDYPDYKGDTVFLGSKLTISTFDRFQTVLPPWTTSAVDMESYALAKTCRAMGREFVCFKYISDLIGEPSQEEVWARTHSNGQDLLLAKLKEIL